MTRPGQGPDGTRPPYYLVAVMKEYESEAAYGADTPEARAARADLANFAMAGATVMAGPASSVK